MFPRTPWSQAPKRLRTSVLEVKKSLIDFFCFWTNLLNTLVMVESAVVFLSLWLTRTRCFNEFQLLKSLTVLLNCKQKAPHGGGEKMQ